MPLPTENVGSLPRPARLQAAIQDYDARKTTLQQLAQEPDTACLDSTTRMEATGAPTVSDGERSASSFATYPLMDTFEGRGLAEDRAPDRQYFAILERVGSTDDCGFLPFNIDTKPRYGSPAAARDIAFEKITVRVTGAKMASARLGF